MNFPAATADQFSLNGKLLSDQKIDNKKVLVESDQYSNSLGKQLDSINVNALGESSGLGSQAGRENSINQKQKEVAQYDSKPFGENRYIQSLKGFQMIQHVPQNAYILNSSGQIIGQYANDGNIPTKNMLNQPHEFTKHNNPYLLENAMY